MDIERIAPIDTDIIRKKSKDITKIVIKKGYEFKLHNDGDEEDNQLKNDDVNKENKNMDTNVTNDPNKENKKIINKIFLIL